ncbi:Tetraspanin-19 [Thalictrum thalictroides]|uniref:Tetraspanin-19 n=1 Tax=Thalictrum thalictroides TaxID=46969 RepID=A0A7J6WJU3_THATH|nr:Tetraspanin-19 [Thalictrum thalictroides]
MGSVKKIALDTSTNTSYHDRSTPMQAYYGVTAIPSSPAIWPQPNVLGSRHLIPRSGNLIQYPTICPQGPNVNPNLTMEQRAAPLSSLTEGIPKRKGQSAPPVSTLTERKISNGSKQQSTAKKYKRSSDNPCIVRESGESGSAVRDLGDDNMSESKDTECDTLSNRSDEDTLQNEQYTSDEDTSDEDTACEDLETEVVKKKRKFHSLTQKLKRISEECQDISDENGALKEKLTSLLGKERMLPFENLESKFLDSSNGDSKNKKGESSSKSDTSLSEKTANGHCLSCYMVFIILLTLLEAAVTADIYLNRDWEEDFPSDPTGKFDEFKHFVRSNFDFCKWVCLFVVAAQGLSIFLSIIIRALTPQGQYYDSDDEYVSARLPLLINQAHPTSYVVGEPHITPNNDRVIFHEKVNR